MAFGSLSAPLIANVFDYIGSALLRPPFAHQYESAVDFSSGMNLEGNAIYGPNLIDTSTNMVLLPNE